MLDIKWIRENADRVRENLKNRHHDADVDEIIRLDEERRTLLAEVEKWKADRNAASKEIAKCKKEGGDASEIIARMKKVSDAITGHDQRLRDVEEKLHQQMLEIPNVCDASVPVGEDENDNIEVRRYGTPREFGFEVKAHWDIGAGLGILDPETAAKVTGARFHYYLGAGAQLERAVYNFMLDMHTQEFGFIEVIPPYIINEDSMIGTGQLPKFAEDMFKLEGLPYYLTPTAEVPLTNFHRDEIINGEVLPQRLCALTPCFRAEAGSAGRDTRGLIRQHQFHKVEMVKFAKPEESYEELESMTLEAEQILRRLALPYRVITLCTGDIGFSAAKTYDIEVWMPAQETYREISSCSNCEAFQARRANIKFRRSAKDKPEYVHTLNGSGLAVGRTVAAILENNQQQDGSVIVPKALRPYMHGLEVITPVKPLR
ncbi:MAG: serine--tRNA ligase [Negativicoccus succinicivorans]|uniref:serine--tRNA ligase n=1 Tax=Negativicoccus succinicivorans TaxID=620903 RepID=UPI0029017033|nr:serine--tRNA ligase [Negativicoccus succinicivorans]MDU2644122.1 serine--tRNA ligase [Negativicoccus succinicivorans]MDU5288273.1 serine--tRNA ligase [Negativicoccus succinicivorans]